MTPFWSFELYSDSILFCSELSESELLYDWRFTANQFVLATRPLRLTPSHFIFQLNTCGHRPYVTSSLTDERMGLSFTIDPGPHQRSHSQVRFQRDSWPHFTVSDLRFPHPGGQIPVFISPRNSVSQLYPQALGSFFIASYDSQGYNGGIRLRLHTGSSWLLLFNLGTDQQRKHLQTRVQENICWLPASMETLSRTGWFSTETCLSIHSLAMGLHVTVFICVTFMSRVDKRGLISMFVYIFDVKCIMHNC
jgi:hypothetical protein